MKEGEQAVSSISVLILGVSVIRRYVKSLGTLSAWMDPCNELASVGVLSSFHVQLIKISR